MEIYKKLQQARDHIKANPMKKAGYNQHSKYWYYTPEQINSLVHEAEKQTGLIHIFNLRRDSDGLHGHLQIFDIENQESINFIQATDIPSITATNIAQQIGGSVTFTTRYMLQTAYDISDNSLDFDSKDNREPEKKVQPTANGKEIPEKAKMKISNTAFNQLIDKLKANPNPVERGNLLAKTRRYYLPMTEDQEKLIAEITNN